MAEVRDDLVAEFNRELLHLGTSDHYYVKVQNSLLSGPRRTGRMAVTEGVLAVKKNMMLSTQGKVASMYLICRYCRYLK